MNREKVLIIKLGMIELLDHQQGSSVALGDVFRCTSILPAFHNCHVTWLTDRRAFPLLEKNPLISRLMHYDLTTVFQLQAENFDSIVNLEKVPGICALADSLKAWRKFGFRYNAINGETAAYVGAERVLELSGDNNAKRSTRRYFNEFLYEIIGRTWEGQDMILGYTPKVDISADVGFNFRVGPKWPVKAWPELRWQELESLLCGKFLVDWQKGEGNLYQYMDWLASCRLIVTNDSLGLHLALALGKKVVALFGPTWDTEVYIPEVSGVRIVPKSPCPLLPCMQGECNQPVSCMNFIEAEEVAAAIFKLLGE